MQKIELTRDMFALIDDEDIEEVSKYNWRARKGRNTYYATTHIGDWRDKKNIHLHNLVMNTPAGFIIDHKDHNGLNCQKDNMRICTKRQNGKNRSSWGVSKYLGVSQVKHKTCIRWEAKIFSDGERKYLGSFRLEKEAAIAYNNAAQKIHGVFANLNAL